MDHENVWIAKGLAFIVFCIAVVVWATAYASLWNWFIVPFGAPAIGKMHALGIMLCLEVVAIPFTTAIEFQLLLQRRINAFETLAYRVANLAMALTAWGVGAVAHWFM